MTDTEPETPMAFEPDWGPHRVRPDFFYVMIFISVGIIFYGAQNIFDMFVQFESNIYIYAISILFPFLAAAIAKIIFLKTEKRGMVKREASRLSLKSYAFFLILHILFTAILFFGAAIAEEGSFGVEAFAVLFSIFFFIIIAFLFVSIFQFIAIYLGFKLIGLNKSKERDGPLFDQSGQRTMGEDGAGFGSDIVASENNITVETAKATNDSWVAPHERSGFAVRDERAPWLKWTVSILALLIVGGGAAWLTSKVVISDDLPVTEKAEKVVDKKEDTPPPKSADDEAWVKALEIDTVKGYRDYLAAFPEGRHKEDAIRLINEFDNEAWATAQERDTIQGYEDYIEAWPEGLHVAEARKRIAEIKAAEEARRKNAQEAVRQEAAAWQAAAQANTIPAYEGYLSKFPAGKNAAEAQSRIDRLRASQADEAAWAAADASKTADAYQQYLTSFPQGKYVPEAIKRLEDLRPSPGKTFQDCAGCPTMVTLATGTVNLGAGPDDGEAKPNEKPARPVTFSKTFSIGVTEVTFSQYEACVSAGACGAVPGDNGWGRGNRPVINVSWSDAVAYAEWLSRTTGKSYSLPSDAQWEFAARGGEKSVYPGGSPKAVCAFANGASKESGLPWANQACTDLAADRTLPVGSLSKNKFGIQDMIGNVSEWVLDCNTLNLRDAPVDGSADARGSCSQRIVRGGSWFSGAESLRYSARVVQRRGDTNDFTGFRVVRN